MCSFYVYMNINVTTFAYMKGGYFFEMQNPINKADDNACNAIDYEAFHMNWKEY